MDRTICAIANIAALLCSARAASILRSFCSFKPTLFWTRREIGGYAERQRARYRQPCLLLCTPFDSVSRTYWIEEVLQRWQFSPSVKTESDQQQTTNSNRSRFL